MRFRSVFDFLGVLFSHKRLEALPGPGVARQEFAVIGLGRFGSSLALALVARGHTVLGIDSNEALVQDLADEITQTVTLDSTDEDALREIDIASYETVVVAIGSQFEANLMTTVALKAVGVRTVVCKAGTERQKQILLNVGADRVVLPEHDSGRRIGYELAVPGILDQISLGTSARVSELKFPAKYEGKTLGEIGVEKRFRLFVAAVVRKDSVVSCPELSYRLGPDDLLIVVGEESDVARLLTE